MAWRLGLLVTETGFLDTTTFAELGLSPKVLAAVEAAGYASPTPIQQQAIPVAVTGRDVLGIAQTGTGKTAGFVLPMITRLETGRARARMPRSLILAPTRELAAQVAQSFEKYGVNHKLTLALLIGGVSFDDQYRKLDRGVDVLIATPGRLLDHFQRGKLMLMGVEILVIDEADRMLDMGFIPDIERICKLLPPRRQTLFFSATMPSEIQRLVASFLKDPVRVEVARPATTANTITQRFYYCPTTDDWAKRETLRELIRTQDVKNAIIFCNRKRDVAILLKSLLKHGFNAGALHGDMDQMSRMKTLDSFRDGTIQFLAASDVAARGLDIPDVSHVFNFDVPWAADDYVHRIGRTGRAGREGFSATLVTPDDFKQLKDIEKMLGTELAWIGEAPSEEDVAAGSRRGGRGRGGRAGARRGASDSRRSGERGEARGSEARGGEARGGGARRGDRKPERAPRREEERAEPRAAREHRPDAEQKPAAEIRQQPPARQGHEDEARAAKPARTGRVNGERARPGPRREPKGDQRPRGDDQRPRGDNAPAKPRGDAGQQGRSQKTSRSDHRQDDRPVGFSGNVPAFLKKPVRAGT
ncbi:MAG: DEAD/DEAH box helicase [Hyphomicrobiaceae bacterium]